jgi:hypothetical protein
MLYTYCFARILLGRWQYLSLGCSAPSLWTVIGAPEPESSHEVLGDPVLQRIFAAGTIQPVGLTAHSVVVLPFVVVI